MAEIVEAEKEILRKDLILPASQALFFEAIQTLPITPRKADLFLYADGLAVPHNLNDDRHWAPYILECATRGIIPFSRLPLVYEGHSNAFEVESRSLPSLNVPSSRFANIKKAAMGAAIKGGRFSEIWIKSECEAGSALLRDELCPVLLSQGYHISGGEFALSSFYNNERPEYRYRLYDYRKIGFRKGLEIDLTETPRHLTEDLSPEKKEELRTWAKALEKKYNPGASQPSGSK